MRETTKHYKTAIVCMVYDGYEYLSEFLNYYRNLCDHIYIIDHNSQIDLRQLKIKDVTFIRSNHEAQFQSECTNLVIEHFNIKKKYDWLFVLDIDEFLPFTNKVDFYSFLHKHRNDYVIKLHWRNGVPFYDEEKEIPTSLINCSSIRFFYKKGIQYKSFININKTKGQFFVPTGSHTICRILPYWRARTPFLKNRKDYIPATSDLTLFHIVAFNKSAFVKKIKNYIKQLEYREHVTRQGGGIVRDYPDSYSGDEWLWYIGNFRVKDSNQFFDVKKEYFLEHNIFDHLNANKIIELKDKIIKLHKVAKKKSTLEEQAYLSYKSDDRNVLENIRWFHINPENEIVTIIPESDT